MQTPIEFTRVAVLTGILVLACGAEENGDALVVGVLLPFTGERAATAYNLEQAAIMAKDSLNDGGGINGTPIRLRTLDTHSDPEQTRAKIQELLDAKAVAVIGPEGVAESRAALEVAERERVPFASPYVSAADTEPGEGYPWWRFAPSPFVLGEAVAKKLREEGEDEIALVAGRDSYSQSFASGVRSRFESLRGAVVCDLTLPGEEMNFLPYVKELTVGAGRVVVLSADVATSAKYVNDVAVDNSHPNLSWWFSPLLQTQEFVRNVAPQSVEGARGVAPGVYAKSQAAFEQGYGDRWGGDVPMQAAYYYYDAVALLGVALQTAFTLDGGQGTELVPELETIVEGMTRSTRPTGTQFAWDELKTALEFARDGKRAFYQGITGSISWENNGDRRTFLFAWWTIEQGDIVTTTKK